MSATRRLAAILAADVAGFSVAMERDEEGAFALVQELRHKVIEPRIAEHQGRLIKTTGDGFLAEFASPIAATRCALATASIGLAASVLATVVIPACFDLRVTCGLLGIAIKIKRSIV